MSSLSPIYRDTTKKNDGADEAAIRAACIEEERMGHIPVIVRSNRNMVKFYVTRDVSIQDILTSFHHDSIQLDKSILKVCSLTYSPRTQQYQDAKELSDYGETFDTLFGTAKVEILILLQ